MQKYFKDIITQVDNAFNDIDSETFNLLLDDCKYAIRNGGKIVATGLGKNEPICEKFVGTMTSLGLSSAFMNTNTAMHGDLGLIRDNDVVLILTKSGSTAESVHLYNYISDWKCEKWLLSFNDGGKLGKLMSKKLLLPLEHEGDKWDIVPNNSSTCYLVLLQGLALYLSEKLDVSLAEFKRNHPGGAIGEKLLNE
ncbi:MAG: SIS domain-containing protein [Oscillospiraceae bacterium]|jgi:arabinose-5-phosphate isomerase|nr:SIS domain-containing protein [Oscillospiraceae bacterium]